MTQKQKILVTGGAGYVGCLLAEKLINAGHEVVVYDLFLYGEDVFPNVKNNPKLHLVKADLRDQSTLQKALQGCNVVIHLACISNDPSFELNPDLGKSINFDCFEPLVKLSQEAGVKRFIYASSSSVYGIKDEPNVTEDLELQPLTDYSKFKAMCEDVLLRYQSKDFTTLVIRPATVCGYSARLRLDLTVNILTNHALTNKLITVFGGTQLRPNIHIEDITDLYVQALDWDKEKIAGKIYNAGYDNMSVGEIAEKVKKHVGEHVQIKTTPTDDLRSYHISSQKIADELGFKPKKTIDDAIVDLIAAFKKGLVPNSMTDEHYYNIKLMQKVNLK